MGNGTNGTAYRWAIGLLVSVVLLLVGMAVGNQVGTAAVAGQRAALEIHEQLDGHVPVVERVQSLTHGMDQLRVRHDRDIQEVKEILVRIEAKLDRQIERQRGGGP